MAFRPSSVHHHEDTTSLLTTSLSLGSGYPENVTSNSNLELPKFVLCFCQKLSGLIIRAMWMQQGKDSCKIFSSGLMESHLEPRMSTITVKPRLQTSSLQREKEVGELERWLSW